MHPNVKQRETIPAVERVRAAKEALGSSVVVLGHHYQTDDVIQFADFRGDSLKLARQAANTPEARAIVFCGVHFMAETASILAQPDQTVLLPDREAGCFLADMAARPHVEEAWAALGELMDVEHEVTPVTYVNSAANLKAFCGEHGGVVCTSSNADRVLQWALERRPRVLFFPDQHLGRNTAKKMGVLLDKTLIWNPSRPNGGHTADALDQAQIYLWRGWCNVHRCFKPEHVRDWRRRDPDVRVIVHPECEMAVVDLADEAGSTAYIIQRIEESPPGTHWAVGTESDLVNRLQKSHPEQLVASLSPEPIFCRTMNRVTVEKLARVLEGLVVGKMVNPISVPDGVARHARVALERMLEVS